MMAPDALRNMRVMFLGLWAGSGVIVAVAAQVLSSSIADRAAFGQAVSPLFRYHAVLGLLCAGAYLALLVRDKAVEAKRRRLFLVLGSVMLACVLAYFATQPVLANLRAAAGPGGVGKSAGAALFGMLHAGLLLLYIVQTVLAVYVLWREARTVGTS